MNKTNNWYYGYLSGLVTAVALQPLDNIKMVLMMPPSSLSIKMNSNFAKNIYSATAYLHLQQGFHSFYRGLVVNVWKTGLGSALYFYALRIIQDQQSIRTSFSNFVTSASARVISSVITNPFAVIEARYQIPGNQRLKGNVFQNMVNLYKMEGVGSYFKGCQASCLKQAGFAGIYYTLYEKGKQFQLGSLLSGMTSGIISTLITHPLQIIRTAKQVSTQSNSFISQKNKSHRSRSYGVQNKQIWSQLVRLFKQGKLLDGVSPRLIKKPAANTIGFLLFEYLEKNNHLHGIQ